ncbi:MAG: hypothetical protein AAB490_01050 [Patescibacteria group bacterium]
MDQELERAASLFDFDSVARLLQARVSVGGFTSLVDMLQVFPELRDRLSHGYDGRGSMAFKMLAKDRESGRVIVLAAMENCAAPPHLHRGGEFTVDFSGGLREHQWTAGSYTSGKPGERRSVKNWGVNTFHQPFTLDGKSWLGIYDQPAGLVAFDKMNRAELKRVFEMSLSIQPAPGSLPLFYELSDEEYRAQVAKELRLMMPPPAVAAG